MYPDLEDITQKLEQMGLKGKSSPKRKSEEVVEDDNLVTESHQLTCSKKMKYEAKERRSEEEEGENIPKAEKMNGVKPKSEKKKEKNKSKPSKKKETVDQDVKASTATRMVEEGDYIVDPRDWVQCKCNSYGDGFKVVDMVLKNLSKKQQEKLKEYSVGHLLDLKGKNFKWKPSIAHHLLLRQIAKGGDANAIWFKECGIEFRFSLPEFCLITGLKGKADEDATIPVNNTLQAKYFSTENSKGVRRGELFVAFENCTHEEDKVKLGVAYLVEGLIVGNLDRKLINPDTLRLVDRISAFNKFPWGKLSFDCLFYYMKKFQSWNPHGSSAYQLGGFYPALQIFALEVFPRLARYIARRVDGNGTLGRILRWEMKGAVVGYKTLIREVFEGNVEVTPLQPTDDERVHPSMDGLFGTMELLLFEGKKEDVDMENEGDEEREDGQNGSKVYAEFKQFRAEVVQSLTSIIRVEDKLLKENEEIKIELKKTSDLLVRFVGEKTSTQA